MNKLDITQTDFARIGFVIADDGRPALLCQIWKEYDGMKQIKKSQ